MQDVLPSSIMTSIQAHLREGCRRGEQGWDSGQDEEDTLTGDLGASLRRPWTAVRTGDGRRWRWRMTYSKFRGRGPAATEKAIGADGIFQIEVEDLRDRTIETKGLLFQAKKKGRLAVAKLLDQVERMAELVPRGSAVIEYAPDGYRAADAEELLKVAGHLERVPVASVGNLGEFLASRFLPCKSGARGLYYEASRKTLFVPHRTKAIVRYRHQLRHRFRIDVQAR